MPQPPINKTISKRCSEDYCLVYVTCANVEEAEKIGTALVKQRLVACVNILPPIQSVYWWKGQVESAAESAFVAKTRRVLMADLTEKIKKMHGYDLPCVVALPLQHAEAEFLDWIDQETRPSKNASLAHDPA